MLFTTHWLTMIFFTVMPALISGEGAATLAWIVSSPPPFYMFDELPTLE